MHEAEMQWFEEVGITIDQDFQGSMVGWHRGFVDTLVIKAKDWLQFGTRLRQGYPLLAAVSALLGQ